MKERRRDGITRKSRYVSPNLKRRQKLHKLMEGNGPVVTDGRTA